MLFWVVSDPNPILGGGGGKLEKPSTPEVFESAHSIFKLGSPESVTFSNFSLRAGWHIFWKNLNRGGFRTKFLGKPAVIRPWFLRIYSKGLNLSKGNQFYVEWGLSHLNRLITLGYRTLQIKLKIFCVVSLRPLNWIFGTFKGSRGGSHRNHLKTFCPNKIGR